MLEANIEPKREWRRRGVRRNGLAVNVMEKLIRARRHVPAIQLRERRAEAREDGDKVGRNRGTSNARERQQQNAHFFVCERA